MFEKYRIELLRIKITEAMARELYPSVGDNGSERELG